MTEITEVKLAILGIIVLEISIAVLAYLNHTACDIGIVATGIAAIAGLAGFDMGQKK